MKKFFTIIILLIIMQIGNVKAESFYEDNWITGVYATYESDTLTKPQLMRFIRKKGDNKEVYCLTPSERLYEDQYYNGFLDGTSILNKNTLKRVKDIARFGYGYLNHTSNEWYSITQYMIWKEVDNADIYFTDKFKGNRINRFQNEMLEINNLINDYYKVPNINDLELTINHEFIINDDLLSKFDIETDLDYIKDNNTLIIKPNRRGNFKVRLIKKDTLDNKTMFYRAEKGQDILLSGSIDDVVKEININVTGGSLEIKKVDSISKDIIPQKNTLLQGAIYNLYDSNNEVVKELVIDEDSKAFVSDLKYGKYYLKEEKAPLGYMLDDKIYEIIIDKEFNFITLEEDVIKSDVTINKYARVNEQLVPEDNIIFELYDSSNNLIEELVTDDDGIIKKELTFGIYKLKQKTSWLGYEKIEDIEININDNNDKVINIINEKIKSNLRIIKKDSITEEIIKEETGFKIKNLDTNLYIENGKIFKTINGVVDIPILGGKYSIEEVEPPNGYVKGDSTELIINDKDPVEVTIFNDKEVLEKSIDENIDLKTFYPTTSNIDAYIYFIVGYLLFIGFILLLMRVNDEK